MNNTKKIAPDEVEVISEVKTLYRAKGQQQYYLDETRCREEAATVGRCKTCGGKTQYKHWLICNECQERQDREKHAQKLINSPEWDGSYPVCLGEDFFFDEDAFLDHIVVYDICPDDIDDLYACTPIYASDVINKGNLMQQVEESMGFEDAECPAKIEVLIDGFIADLKTIEKPICWVGNKLVRLTTEQIMMISAEKNKAEKAE